MMDEENIQELKEQYNKMNSAESWKYTEEILYAMGNEIQKRFPGVDFILKARFKSPKSHNGKIDRIMQKPGNDEKKIFDDVGFCLIVKSVSDDFEFDHSLCEMSVEDRTSIGLEIDNEQSSMAIIEAGHLKELNQYEKLKLYERNTEEINKLKSMENPDEDLIKLLEDNLEGQEHLKKELEKLSDELKSKSEKVIRIGNQYYSATDNKINEMIATHIMNKLTNDKEFMNSLNLKIMLGRKKFHDGGKSGYYRAYHDTVESTKLPWWVLELQALSYQNYVTSKEGKARHSKCEGKSRNLPRLGRTPEEKEKFRKAVIDASPKNLVYQNGVYKNGKQIKPGKVYKCSDVENMTYFYLEVLRDKPDLFKYIIGTEELFSDKCEVIER